MTTSAHEPRPGPRASAPAEAGSRRTVVVLLVVLALAAFALVTLGASAQRDTLAVFEGESGERTPVELEEKEEYTEPDWTVYDVPAPAPRSEAPGVAAKVAVALLAAILLVAVIVLIRRLRKLARPPREEAAEVE